MAPRTSFQRGVFGVGVICACTTTSCSLLPELKVI